MALPPFAETPSAGTAPLPYVPGNLPGAPQGLPRYLQDELRRLEATLQTVILLTPQTATRAPRVPIDGMQRYAKDPWRPVVGQTTDRWVTYVAGAWAYL